MDNFYCRSVTAADAGLLELTGLARAAVAGDERALDLFSSWRPKTGKVGAYGLGETRYGVFWLGVSQFFNQFRFSLQEIPPSKIAARKHSIQIPLEKFPPIQIPGYFPGGKLSAAKIKYHIRLKKLQTKLFRGGVPLELGVFVYHFLQVSQL